MKIGNIVFTSAYEFTCVFSLLKISKRFKSQSQQVKGFIDYYQILGVTKNATIAEIKCTTTSLTNILANYFNLARKYHPDINPDPEAKEKFEKIMKAYEVLSDQDSKDEYDGKIKSSYLSRIADIFNDQILSMCLLKF